jgi:hypothetical protein
LLTYVSLVTCQLVKTFEDFFRRTYLLFRAAIEQWILEDPNNPSWFRCTYLQVIFLSLLSPESLNFDFYLTSFATDIKFSSAPQSFPLFFLSFHHSLFISLSFFFLLPSSSFLLILSFSSNLFSFFLIFPHFLLSHICSVL